MANGERNTVPPGWQKAEIVAKIAAALLVPVVILVAGHTLAAQQARTADALQNSDRVADLLGHLASQNPQERILAIQALRFHRDAHAIPEEIVASLLTVAATDNVDVAAAAAAALGTGVQAEIEKQRLLLELLGPMMIHLDRTRNAFRVWNDNNTVLVTGIIRDGNAAVRSLLVDRSELIPSDLVDDAVELLKHYDAWFREYERVRREGDTPYVFVGPKGVPFPTASEERFRKRYESLVSSTGRTVAMKASTR